MDDLELLRAVRARLARPEAWTKGYLAINCDGETVYYRGEGAVAWCLIGAAYADGRDIDMPDEVLASGLGFKSHIRMIEWNDDFERTHAEVLARLDAAIQAHTEE